MLMCLPPISTTEPVYMNMKICSTDGMICMPQYKNAREGVSGHPFPAGSKPILRDREKPF